MMSNVCLACHWHFVASIYHCMLIVFREFAIRSYSMFLYNRVNLVAMVEWGERDGVAAEEKNEAYMVVLL